MKLSSGTLLVRSRDGCHEVLLVHPSGNYNRKAPWSIPKGIPDQSESLEATARRETREETGVHAGDLAPLGFVTYQKSGKQIHCFAGWAPPDASPHCASWEVDRAEFVRLEQARTLLHPDQRPLLDRLESTLLTGQAG